MTDSTDLTTAYNAFKTASRAYIEAIEAENLAEKKLIEKEQEIHKEKFRKVLAGDRSMAEFERILKYETTLERIDFKKKKKIKQIARQNEKQSEEELNYLKKMISL